MTDEYTARAKEYLERILQAQRHHGHPVKLSKDQLGRAVERTTTVFRKLGLASEAARKQK